MRVRSVAAIVVMAALAQGCAGAQDALGSQAGAADGAACNLSGFLAAQHAHVNHAEVTLCGVVERVRAPRISRSGVHRVFYVDVGGGDRIEIDANLDVMGDFPVHDGEAATIRGEYYYDEDGHEGVHWTHHTSYGSHPPGYVILEGKRYE